MSGKGHCPRIGRKKPEKRRVHTERGFASFSRLRKKSLSGGKGKKGGAICSPYFGKPVGAHSMGRGTRTELRGGFGPLQSKGKRKLSNRKSEGKRTKGVNFPYLPRARIFGVVRVQEVRLRDQKKPNLACGEKKGKSTAELTKMA